MTAKPRHRRRLLADDGRVPDEHWFAQMAPITATLAERVAVLEATLAQMAERIRELGQALGLRGVPSTHDREPDPPDEQAAPSDEAEP